MKQNPTLTRVIKRIASKKGVTFEKVYQAMKKSPIHAKFSQPEMVADGWVEISEESGGDSYQYPALYNTTTHDVLDMTEGDKSGDWMVVSSSSDSSSSSESTTSSTTYYPSSKQSSHRAKK